MLEDKKQKACLENSKIKLVVTNKGQIISLFNKTTNTELIHANDPTGWRMITTLGEWNEHPVFDFENTGVISESDNHTEIWFEGLTGCEDDRLDIKLGLFFCLSGESDKVEMKAKIYNGSHETVRELFFPFISGLTKIDEDKKDFLVLPLEMGTIMEKPLENLPVANKYGIRPRPGGNFFAMEFWPQYPLSYPGVACLPFMDFYNSNQGLYLGYHDKETPTTALLARRDEKEESFQLGFSRYPFIELGENFESGSYVIELHKGDWHNGANCYRDFAATKIKDEQASPQWIKNAPGLHFSFHIGQNRHIMNDYDTLLEKFKRNKELGLDMPLFVFGWVKTGFDNGYPEYEPDPRLGGKEKLKAVVKEITDRGGKVIFYTQGRLIDKSTDFYKEIGNKICLKNEYGTEYIDEYSFNKDGTVYPGKLFALGCPATEGWYQQLKKQIDIVMDIGGTGILFDQIAGDVPFLCFDKSHPHAKPDMAFDAKIKLLERLQIYAAGIDPEFIIMSELVCDVYLQHVDLSHGMASHRENDGPVRYLPEMYKYVFPKHRITSRNASSIKAYNQTFAMGFVSEYRDGSPDLDYLEKLLKLRVKYERFFVKGRFLDTDGVLFDDEKLLVKVFDSEDKSEKAVIIVNESKEKVTAEIAVNRVSENWMLRRVNSGGPECRSTPRSEKLIIELESDELAIAVIK